MDTLGFMDWIMNGGGLVPVAMVLFVVMFAVGVAVAGLLEILEKPSE